MIYATLGASSVLVALALGAWVWLLAMVASHPAHQARAPKAWEAPRVVVRFPSPAAVSGQVLVGGHDLSHACRAVRVDAVVGELVGIRLELIGQLVVEADAPAVARVLSLEDLRREAGA